MAEGCQLYYITNRAEFPGDELTCRRALLAKIAEAARAEVDYIQLREKDLSARELERLAQECVAIIRNLKTEDRELRTRVVINSRTDIALAASADGVHLRANDISPSAARSIWREAAARDSQLAARPWTVAVSCHSPAAVARAQSQGADFAVFAPVFEKKDAPSVEPRGIEALREACLAKIPVFALGGVTLANAAACLSAGARGIAGIRLFQQNRVEDVVRALRKS
jgi:thiamine-phosphate pyrophosphorylase